MRITDRTYDILKRIVQIVLPALGTLYFALAGIWHLPYVEQVLGTITAVTTFLGAILGISTSQWRKNGMDGTLEIDTTSEDKDTYLFNVDDLDALAEKDIVMLNVKKK